MVLATLLAMVLLYRQHFLTGTIDAMYAALSNSSYQFALCVIIGFGGMITLFQESGALMGFRDLLLKIASGPKRTLVLAWLMSAIMFLDEYLSALTVTFSMREITDKNRIPGSIWRCRPISSRAACVSPCRFPAGRRSAWD